MMLIPVRYRFFDRYVVKPVTSDLPWALGTWLVWDKSLKLYIGLPIKSWNVAKETAKRWSRDHRGSYWPKTPRAHNFLRIAKCKLGISWSCRIGWHHWHWKKFGEKRFWFECCCCPKRKETSYRGYTIRIF